MFYMLSLWALCPLFWCSWDDAVYQQSSAGIVCFRDCLYCCRWCPECRSHPHSRRWPSTVRTQSWGWWSSYQMCSWLPAGHLCRCRIRCLQWRSSSRAGQRWGCPACPMKIEQGKEAGVQGRTVCKQTTFLNCLLEKYAGWFFFFLSPSYIFLLLFCLFLFPPCINPFSFRLAFHSVSDLFSFHHHSSNPNLLIHFFISPEACCLSSFPLPPLFLPAFSLLTCMSLSSCSRWKRCQVTKPGPSWEKSTPPKLVWPGPRYVLLTE